MATIFIIMGVSGCGKTTVGSALAARLGVPFYDGDDFHPPQNVAKMAGGIPLTDDDRYPWLARLHELISEHLMRGETAVLACSALKKQYRNQLRQGSDAHIQMVYLQGSPNLIRQRLQTRPAHYMKANMLQSQFAALQPPSPQNTLILNAEQTIEDIVAQIIRFSQTSI
ncbi:MAG: gluconokinase [Ardenticatenaceae bacterium]|nr:gluconokinase [Ardenticatenaceae bacterium]MCB8989363.1 gluconokinase [Ardenticatenaceae bacterium]MCB9004518.1 gluconokinase [Ardenticatenaceae bacterium]